ncbi:hypothetical protein PG991_003599 [Apiospora marii]|uniref:Uncharacterized protein n=1 Tax=Apiospora marii TaxID=335849 RepID=A0ABR1S3X2_9PEZI
MQSHCGRSLAHRISKWMLISFLDSASQRELLRTLPFIATSSTPARKEGGHSDGNDGDGEDYEENWVEPILYFWDQDGLGFTDEQSDGAREGIRTIPPPSDLASREGIRAKLLEPIFNTVDSNSRVKDGIVSPIAALISPEDEDDEYPASLNSAIWSLEDNLKQMPVEETDCGERDNRTRKRITSRPPLTVLS